MTAGGHLLSLFAVEHHGKVLEKEPRSVADIQGRNQYWIGSLEPFIFCFRAQTNYHMLIRKSNDINMETRYKLEVHYQTLNYKSLIPNPSSNYLFDISRLHYLPRPFLIQHQAIFHH